MREDIAVVLGLLVPLQRNSLCPGGKAPKLTPLSVTSCLSLALFEAGGLALWEDCSQTGKA